MRITVVAHRWERGWELWLDGEPATQVDDLRRAESQVRDYLDTVNPHVDHSRWRVTVLREPETPAAACAIAQL